MPELPDVEVFRRYVNATALHQKIGSVSVRSHKILDGISEKRLKAALEGNQFSATRRHGKHLFAEVNGHWLVFHFGMTGFLKYFKQEQERPEYEQIVIDFANGYHLSYDCRRKLGRMRLTDDVENFIHNHELGPDALDDPDVAWVRSDPTDSDNIQLAVKKSYIDKNRWYWRAWADAGIADAAMFDYNDQFTEKEAGSPNKNGGFYPIAALHMMDSTCWIAYNLTPTGTEVGGCVQVQPTQQAPPPADEPEEPGCDCSISYRQLSRECCTVCGDYMWDSAINQCVTMY